MNVLLNEKQVLDKLGVTDFRHITKDKLITFASMLDKMDPEVAKKALEQFPKFANVSREVFCDYKKTIENILMVNDNSVKAYYDVCDTIISALKNESENDNLTFEEKQLIFEHMKEVADMIAKKDSENKKFYEKIALGAGTIIVVTIGVLSAILGGKMNILNGNVGRA